MVATQQDEARFYAERDQRTLQYGAVEAALEVPIVITADASVAASRAGAVAVLALVDMLFRVHRHVRLDLPNVVLASGESLVKTALRAASAIDPFQDPLTKTTGAEISVHVAGTGVPSSSQVTAMWIGGCGHVAVAGRSVPDLPDLQEGDRQVSEVLGAATAACLAAAAVFTLVHGGEPSPTAFNLLTLTEGADATATSPTGPVDVGVVHVVGGGAVGHALTYWAAQFGVVGDWFVVDADDAELHNTNRCMGMTVAAAGWPVGLATGEPINKARSAASTLECHFRDGWYHEVRDELPVADLVLVLANEHGVREFIASSGEPVLLHATTSAQWTAELHRHVPSRDDCPACRIPSDVSPAFGCSEGPANPGDSTSSDAALPFLSATAGLMLLAALLDLSGSNERATVLAGKANHWRLHLELFAGMVIQRNVFRGGRCPHHLPEAVRKRRHEAIPGRWVHLDRSRI